MLRLWLLVAAAVLALTATACTPAPRELTPREVLDRAADEADKINSAHFSLEQQNGSVQLAAGVQIFNAEGDVQKPDRIQMNFTLRMAGFSAESQLIVIGSDIFLSNPLTGQWQAAPSAVVAPRVLDQQRGISSLLRKMTDPQKIGNESLDGAMAQHIKGKVPGSVFTDLTGAPATADSVAGDVWVGANDFLLRQVRLEGEIGAGDTASTVRILKFSRFNQPVTIERPT